MVAVCACVYVVTTYHIRHIGAFPLPKLHGQGHLHFKIPPAQLCTSVNAGHHGASLSER